jgi:hypothetical protein
MFSLVAITVDVVRKIVKGDELDFTDSATASQGKDSKKKETPKKGEPKVEDAVVTEGWLEASGFFELRSRLALNIQRTDGPVCSFLGFFRLFVGHFFLFSFISFLLFSSVSLAGLWSFDLGLLQGSD